MNKAHIKKGSIFILLGILSMYKAALAAEHDDGHQPMAKSSSLSISFIFEKALANTPQYLEYSARGDQAQAFTNVGESWIAGRPSLQLSYYDDRLQSNVGQKEMEYGVALPLWRLGEKKDAQRLGERYSVQTELWLEALKLEVAGVLRANFAAIQEAEAVLMFEEQAIEDASQLLSITTALLEAGEVSRLEVMQVQSLLLEQRSAALQAEAALVDAERDYTIFTGLDSRPSEAHVEILSQQDDINAFHPLLKYLRSGVDLAEANVQQAENQSKGAPILTLGSRRDRGLNTDAYIDSVGVALSIPFGGKSLVSSQTSRSRIEKVESEVAYQNTFRALDLALHEVEHELFLLEEALLLSEEKNNLTHERWEMAKSAFELGEINLAAVILTLQQAHTSAKEFELLQLEGTKLITEYNQIVGELL